MAVIVSTPRVIKDFEKLDGVTQEQIKLEYPFGFEDHLVSFVNREGNRVLALPFETEEKHYLVRMTVAEALQLIEDDEDYDNEGNLREEAKAEYEEKLDASTDDEEQDLFANDEEEVE